jgi:AAA ATPase-like protein
VGEHPPLPGGKVARGRALGEDWAGRQRGRVVGREVELALLADFLVAGQSGSQALVLDGVAGIGKTTLFDATVTEARERGYAVFCCRPAGAEAAFSFAALADLLGPVLPAGLERLPQPQRRALAVALLLEESRGVCARGAGDRVLRCSSFSVSAAAGRG